MMSRARTGRLKPEFETKTTEPAPTIRPRKRINAPPIMDQKHIDRYLELHSRLRDAIVGTPEERELDKQVGKQWKLLNANERKEVDKRLKDSHVRAVAISPTVDDGSQ